MDERCIILQKTERLSCAVARRSPAETAASLLRARPSTGRGVPARARFWVLLLIRVDGRLIRLLRGVRRESSANAGLAPPLPLRGKAAQPDIGQHLDRQQLAAANAEGTRRGQASDARRTPALRAA